MFLTVKDLVSYFKNKSPFNLAESWDNVGLHVGSNAWSVQNILLTLDIEESTIDEAIQNNCQIIISHHPLIFKSVSSITNRDKCGRIIIKAIENHIALLCLHTNLDIVNGGVNDVLAKKTGLKDYKILHETESEKVFKICVFVPDDHVDNVFDSMSEAGAGCIGNYDKCSFRTEGKGTFRGNKHTNPFIGNPENLECVKETKLEMIVSQKNLSKTIDSMIIAHPYEEVAYDIYPLELKINSVGLGRIGNLETPCPLNEYAKFIKKELNAPIVKISGSHDKIINKVAVCGGSGMSLLREAVKKGADCMVSADLKYHDAQLCDELGIAFIDAGHFHSETIILPEMKNWLTELFHNANINGKIFISQKLFQGKNGEPLISII